MANYFDVDSDIVFVLSGGASNEFPADSLGGYPSSIPISDEIHNLFRDVESRETSDGSTIYRCLYIFNDSDTQALDSIKLTVEDITQTGGSTIYLGVPTRNEIQKLTFTNSPTSGTFQLKLDNAESASITWAGDNSTTATRIQTALRTISILESVTVARTAAYTFTVTFQGVSSNKTFSLLTGYNMALTGTGTPGVGVTRTQQGSPINTVTVDIGDEKTPPTGVTFVLAVNLAVGNLQPAEGFPVWVQRVVSSSDAFIENDGFTLVVDAKWTNTS